MTAFIQSLWTKTPQWKGLTREYAMMAMYSWKLLAKHYPRELRFFYCDDMDLAFQLVGEDHARELLVPPRVPKHVWAAGKLKALCHTYQDYGHAIHVDSDVFLHQPLPRKLGIAPIIAQSPDPADAYGDEHIQAALRLMGIHWKPHVRAYNAGIIGGARSVMWGWCEAGVHLTREIPETVDGTAASMAVEQWRLGLDFHNRVHTLFPTPRPTAAQLTKAGYAHWCGPEKRKPTRVAELEKKMASQFPNSLAYINSLNLTSETDHAHPAR